VVGAVGEDGGPGDPTENSGAAYVFTQNDGVWQQSTITHASDLQDQDWFGFSVAVAGGTLVVGAPYEDGGAGDPAPYAGAAYLFTRNRGGADNWGEAKILRASDAQAMDWFGYNVAISGETVVVGAYGEDGGAGAPLPEAGAAYLFARNQGGTDNWGEVKTMRASDAQAGDGFGHAVAIDGETAVVGAYLEDGGPGDPRSDAGAAYVFGRNQGGAGNWGEVRALHSSEMYYQDEFGFSVAISGDTLVVSAPDEDGGVGHPVMQCGSAYVFDRNRGGADNWGEVKILRASDRQRDDIFGFSLDIDGDLVVVGAYAEDGGPGDPMPTAGAAYLFERHRGGADNWGEARILRASDRQADDSFGNSVAIAGDSILVGAVSEAGGPGDPVPQAGSAYFFARNNGGADAWGEVQILEASARALHDHFGYSVAIDGDTAVVGAPHREGYEFGNTFDSGVVYVFVRLPCALVRCTAWPDDPLGFAPHTVHFSASAVYLGECDSPVWEWDFGDGTTSSEQNPVHTYASGYYSWTCRVIVGDLQLEIDHRSTIYSCDFDLQATAAPAEGLEPLEVQFSSAVATHGCGAPVTYLWDFGDGGTSTAASPVHTYASGDWPWTLTARTADFARQVSGTVNAHEYSLHFLDDRGRSRLCVNPVSGAFEWQVLTGPAAGIYPGTCQITTAGGLTNYTTPRGLPYELRFRYQPATGHADGVFKIPGTTLESGLDDRNVADNPPGCD